MIVTFKDIDNIPVAGRLGNNLFQIASTIGIAHSNDSSYEFPYWRYEDYFRFPIPHGTETNFITIKEKLDYKFEEIKIHHNTNLSGYFQSYKYFNKVENNIKTRFLPIKKVEEYLFEKYGPQLQKDTCSIHVRHGDYLEKQNIHPILPIEYYNSAKDIINEKYYIVFSDDIQWCKDNNLGDFYVEEGSDIYELFLISYCKNHIIANSSFSWWGAYLSNLYQNKKVIAPKLWSGVVEDTSDLILDSWIRI